jgi:ERCC4-related helicase
VEALARAGLRNPVRVAVAVSAAGKAGAGGEQAAAAGLAQKTPAGLQIQYTILEADQKLPHLLAFLQQHQQSKAIVYFLTCLSVDYYSLVVKKLLGDPALQQMGQEGQQKKGQKGQQKKGKQQQQQEEEVQHKRKKQKVETQQQGSKQGQQNGSTQHGDAAEPAQQQQGQQQQGKERVFSLHGKMKQAAREQTLAAFAAAPNGVLLCTDLAARGLDIPDVHWIVQYDPPQDPSAFVHRWAGCGCMLLRQCDSGM